MKTSDLIKKWCDSRESFSFFLPRGQDGRPFDTQYEVLDVFIREASVVISMSDGIEFVFEGSIAFRDEVCNLVITGYSRLVYKVNGVVVGEFTDGEFCLSGF